MMAWFIQFFALKDLSYNRHSLSNSKLYNGYCSQRADFKK